MRSCEQAQNGGWQRGKRTRDIRWRTGAGKRGRGSWFSQESLHTGCFGYRYFVNSSSRFKTLRVDKQPQTTKVFYHLRLRCVGGLSPPHRWFPGNWAARVKKEFPVLHLHLSPLSSPVLYHHWYLGWHFNTHVKKLKAVRKDVVLQGAPSVLTRLKNKKKKKTAKLLLR